MGHMTGRTTRSSETYDHAPPGPLVAIWLDVMYRTPPSGAAVTSQAVVIAAWPFMRVVGDGTMWTMSTVENRQHLGEEDPFEVFYRREFPNAARLAYVLTGSMLAAEDLAQDALLAASRRWDEIRHLDSPAGWVRRVVSNKSVSLYRRSVAEMSARMRLWSARPEPPDLAPATEEIWSLVRRLPPRQAQVVALAYVEDLSLEQIAAVLGISAPTVGTHLQRGRQRLAELLEEEGS